MVISNIEPASADASFRRYFRVTTNKGIWIVMDAPPEKEPIKDFITIAEMLNSSNVHAPVIQAKTIEQGFLLLEDLGSRTYLGELKQNSESLYSGAIAALINIQKSTNVEMPNALSQPDTNKVPHYSALKLNQEMDLFEEWYVKKHLSLSLDNKMISAWSELKKNLISVCLEQPQVHVHRDYHSRNLMICESNSPGVIDFQDMVIGPIAYDLASIFKDCYIEWPREKQIQWLEQYRLQANKALGIKLDSNQLLRWYDLTGLQRHLKVLGIFCRLKYRDEKDQYLNDLPLVAKYVMDVLDLYPVLSDFKKNFYSLIKASL